MNTNRLKGRMQTLSSAVLVVAMVAMLVATSVGASFAGSQEFTVTPTTVPYSTQPQTISYSIAGGPAGLAYKIDVKAPGGSAQGLAQGKVSSSGTASGTFSDTFSVAGGTYEVAAIFSSGPGSNIADIQVSSTSTTTTTTSTSSSTHSSSSSSTSTSTTSSTTSSTSSSTSGTGPTVYAVKHNTCTADSSAPTTCSLGVDVPADSMVIVFPSTGDRLGTLPSGQTPCDDMMAPPSIISVSSNSLSWTMRGSSVLTTCENVNLNSGPDYPNDGFQILGGEEWYAVASSSLGLSITVTTASANGGSLYSYELNLDVIILQGVDLPGTFGISSPCISTDWTTTLSCTLPSSSAGYVVGNGQALNGMCAGSGFTPLYHSPLAIQNVGVEGTSSTTPPSGLAVTFNQACGVDDNINGGDNIWVMTADVIQ